MTHILTKTLRSGCLFIAFSLLFSFNAKAQNCATPPTCESLGYTDSTQYCPYNGVKCPFDGNKSKCTLPVGEIGDCYYSDGSVRTCVPNTANLGKQILGIYIERMGSYTTATMSGYLIANRINGNWYYINGKCRQEGAVPAENSDLYFNKDIINSSLSILGKEPLITTNLWSGGEFSETQGIICSNASCSGEAKTAVHDAYCVRYIN